MPKVISSLQLETEDPRRMPETWEKAVARLKADLGMRIVPKRTSWLMKAIAYCTPVGWVLGANGFLDDWITTIGSTCYWPKDSWGRDNRVPTLEHEAEHVRQWQRYNVLFSFAYLFLPFPVIITARAYWEFQASCVEMASLHERTGRVADSWIERRLDHYCSSAYFWMFPFRNTLRKLFTEYRDSLEEVGP